MNEQQQECLYTLRSIKDDAYRYLTQVLGAQSGIVGVQATVIQMIDRAFNLGREYEQKG